MHHRTPLILMALIAGGPALAQADTSTADPAASAPQVEYRQTTTIEEGEFRELGIEAELVRPGGIAYFEPARKAFPSWIQLRADFSSEMRDSVEQLR